MTTYITIRNIGAGFYNLPTLSEGKPIIRIGEIVHELDRDENGILVETDDGRVATYAEEADLDQIIPLDDQDLLERDVRDPHWWRTDHTQELVELMQHERTCTCPDCDTSQPDDFYLTSDAEIDSARALADDDWVEEEAERLRRERDEEADLEEAHCPHLDVTVVWQLYRRETRLEPAEYVGRATCNDCGEVMEPEDVLVEAVRHEKYI